MVETRIAFQRKDDRELPRERRLRASRSRGQMAPRPCPPGVSPSAARIYCHGSCDGGVAGSLECRWHDVLPALLARERSPNVRGFPASIKTAKRFAGGASGSREGSRGATAGVRKAPEAGCRRIRRRARRIPSPEGLDCALTRPIARRSRRTSGTSAKRSSGSSAGPSAPGRRETHGQDGRRSARN